MTNDVFHNDEPVDNADHDVLSYDSQSFDNDHKYLHRFHQYNNIVLNGKHLFPDYQGNPLCLYHNIFFLVMTRRYNSF